MDAYKGLLRQVAATGIGVKRPGPERVPEINEQSLRSID
jgi:hypothetical protein